jgi:hypothetical protein
LARKPKDDTPKGGWDTPGVPDLSQQSTHYAAGTKKVKGKLEWVWKPVDEKYLNRNELPKVRKRTRS